MKTVVITGSGSAMGTATPERSVQGSFKAIGVDVPGKGVEISGNLSMCGLIHRPVGVDFFC